MPLDMRNRLNSQGKREGKVIDYKYVASPLHPFPVPASDASTASTTAARWAGTVPTTRCCERCCELLLILPLGASPLPTGLCPMLPKTARVPLVLNPLATQVARHTPACTLCPRASHVPMHCVLGHAGTASCASFRFWRASANG